MKLIIAIILLTMSSAVLAATTADYLKDADRYLQKRDYKAAIIQLKNALQQEPGSAEARLRLGEVYLKVGNGPAAEKEYRRAKKNGASVEQWMPKLAEAMLIQGRGADVLRDINIQNDISSEVKADILGKRGQAYLIIKDIDQATNSFDEALKLDSNNTFALLGAARILVSQKKFEDAVAKIDRALKISPNNVIALTFSAELARQSGELERAKTTYQKALDIFPQHIPALVGMASAQIALKAFSEATKLADKAIKINNELPAPYYIKALVDINDKNMKRAESNLQRVLNLTPGHLPSLLIMGRIQYSNGNYEQAETLLREFNRKISRHLPAIKLLAATRLKLKDLDGAKKLLEKGEALDANDGDILSMLGMAYSQTGQISKGSEYFERAAKISPEKANIQTQLGLSYLAGGELDLAVSTLENAIKLDEGFERADIMLILTHLRKRDYDNALKAANAFAKKQPKNPVVYNFQGVAYGGKGDVEQSRKAFEKALKIKPDFSVSELNLARLDIKEKKIESAKKRFKNVIKHDDKNISAYLGLAKLLLEQGKKEKSLEWVKKINQKQPKAIQPAIVLNRFYLANNEFAKALDVAENTASIYPVSVAVLEMLARTEVANDKLKDALISYERIVKLRPDNPNAYFQLALVHLKNKDIKQTKRVLDKALKLDAKHIGALSTHASLDIKGRKYNPALRRAKVLKEEYEKSAIGWIVEGDVYSAQKKHSAAVISYKLAFEKQLSNKNAIKLAKAYEADGQIQRGIQVLKDWINDHDKDILSQITLAQIYQNAKQNERAIERYHAVITLLPTNLVALNNIAWLYTELNDERAIEYGEKAYELSPNNPSIADTYGWALVNMGDKQKGLRIVQQASMLAPHVGEIRYHLAVALKLTGNIKEAEKEFSRLERDGHSFD